MNFDELIKALHGLEITWYGNKGLELSAIILTSDGRTASIKPLDPPTIVEKKVLKAWGVDWEPAKAKITFDNPKFCLTTILLKPCMKERLEKILKFKAYWISGGGGIGSPICPY
jgi:hypothetical protein